MPGNSTFIIIIISYLRYLVLELLRVVSWVPFLPAGNGPKQSDWSLNLLGEPSLGVLIHCRVLSYFLSAK